MTGLCVRDAVSEKNTYRGDLRKYLGSRRISNYFLQEKEKEKGDDQINLKKKNRNKGEKTKKGTMKNRHAWVPELRKTLMGVRFAIYKLILPSNTISFFLSRPNKNGGESPAML